MWLSRIHFIWEIKEKEDSVNKQVPITEDSKYMICYSKIPISLDFQIWLNNVVILDA